MAGLYELLGRRADPQDETEWADVVDYMNACTDGDYKREFVRKGVALFDIFNAAGWVRPADGGDVCEAEAQNATTCKSTSVNADGTFTSELRASVHNESDLHDANYLLKLHGYDPDRFELVSAKASQWGSGTAPMYSSRIAVKPKQLGTTESDISAWFNDLDRNYSVGTPTKIDGWGSGDKLLVVPISDLHFNMQATLFNSGNEYNCQIAEKVFFHIIADVLERTERYDFQRIVFTIGGDQLDADSPANTTTKGTPQHCDKHYWDACEQLYAMTVKAVDILAQRAPVDVIYVPGNHDNQSGFKLAKYVDAWFRNDDRVSVDYSPLPRHYYVFGKTLFVFAHDGDAKRLQKLIPDEARDVWSNVDFTEVMLQHLHSEALLAEDCNMRIQRLPSPVARSVWTNDQGYRARRQCKSFVYDKELGLTDVVYTTIPC